MVLRNQIVIFNERAWVWAAHNLIIIQNRFSCSAGWLANPMLRGLNISALAFAGWRRHRSRQHGAWTVEEWNENIDFEWTIPYGLTWRPIVPLWRHRHQNALITVFKFVLQNLHTSIAQCGCQRLQMPGSHDRSFPYVNSRWACAAASAFMIKSGQWEGVELHGANQAERNECIQGWVC